MSGQPWLILPTFDEAENIELIVAAALEVLRAAAPEGFHILVVDDDSPDGTGRIADRLALEHDEVEVLHRTVREGLGPAYLAGFRHALTNGAGFVFEMDSDFSHDPADLARLLAAVRDDGADLALGSRYVPGGAVRDWGLVRRIISRGGSLYAAVILGLPVRDLTGGFKCFRAEVLRAIDLPSVRAHGYAFQVELTNRSIRHGFQRRRGADHLPRPPARQVEDEGAYRPRGHRVGPSATSARPISAPRSRWRRWCSCRACGAATAEAAGPRVQARGPTGRSSRTMAPELVVVQGLRDTRGTLERWNARPWATLGPWFALVAGHLHRAAGLGPRRGPLLHA